MAEPLLLMSFENGKVELKEEAMEILSQIEGNISVVSIAGKYFLSTYNIT